MALASGNYGLRWSFPEQNELALTVTEHAAWFDGEYGIARCETAFLDTKFAVVAELGFSMDNFSVQAEDQQIQPIVQGFREVGGDAIGFADLQPAAYFVAGCIRTEDDQFVPGKSGKTGERDLILPPVADFLFERPADFSAGGKAVNVAASGKGGDA